MKKTTVLGLVAFCAFQTSYATTFVYESFDYSVSEGSSMDGVSSTATGLQGNYYVSNSGTSSTTYTTTGLTFSSNFYATSAGAVILTSSTTDTTEASTTLGVQNSTSQSGTLWTSYLVNFSSFGDNSGVSNSALSQSSGTQSLPRLGAYSDATYGKGRAGVGYAFGPNTATAGVNYLQAGTTYLVIASYTNVSEALSSENPGVATLWYFDEASYDAWYSAGALESELSTYSLSIATRTETSGSVVYSASMYQQFYIDTGTAAGTQTATYDELRWGTSLSDVAGIPEPGTSAMCLALLGLGVLLVGRKRLRRTSR